MTPTTSRTARLLAGAAFTLALTGANTARAHGIDANRATLQLAGDTAYLVVTPPAAAFPYCDADDDGLLKANEVRACRDRLLEEIHDHLTVTDEDGRAGAPIFEDVSTPHVHGHSDDAGAPHLRFTLRYRWTEVPTSVALSYGYGELHPLTVQATRLTAERELAKQRPLGPTVSAVLDGDEPRHVFWAQSAPVAPPTAASSDPATLASAFGFLLLAAGLALGARRSAQPTPNPDGEKSR